MISKETIEKLQAPDRRVSYILGARLRSVKEIKETVLSHPGRYQEVHGPRKHSKDPSPLKVKNVQIGERRYVVCVNAEQARKDQADRKAIVCALEEQLRAGPKSMVGNKGYRKFLKSTGSTTDLPQALRDHPRLCVLQLPGVGAVEGTVWPSGGAGLARCGMATAQR